MSDNGVAVQFDHVSKSFGDLKVLDDVSFEIPAGDAFVLLGRSGTGKSVMLKQMMGLIQPDSGRILIEGREITGLKGESLSAVRKRMGYLFQYSALFDSISVGENVAFPLRRHTSLADAEVRERVERLLDQVSLGGQYEKMPADMSGGMRKRAGLARALALDPSTLLVDEPSSGLDPITADEIDRLLLGLKQQHGVTLVMVTHNIPSARRIGDELAMLDQGRIVAHGAPADFERSDDKNVRRFMKAQGGT